MQPPAPDVGTGVGIPPATNIDANAGRPQNPYGTVGEPAVSTNTGVQLPPVTATPTTATPNPAVNIATQGVPSLQQQALQQADDQVNQANAEIAQIWAQIQPLQQKVTDLQAQAATNPVAQAALATETGNLNALYTSLSAAMGRAETASTAKSQTIQKVIDSVQLTPDQAAYYRAQADKATSDAATAKAQTQVLTDGAPGQRALVAAQAGLAGAQAAAAKATSDATTAKTPAEVAQLNAQASALNAQATQTQALLPGLVQKQSAEVGLTQAQTQLTGSQSDLAQAQAGQAQANTALLNAQATLLTPAQAAATQATAGLTQAQTQLTTPAEAANQASQAALNMAKVQQAQQGPLYGLQDQINAIRAIQQQVFGAAGSGADVEGLRGQADALLNQYVSAAIGGTTPYAASVAAQNAQQNIFGTQAALSNQASQAAAARANAYTGLGGNVFATLAGMNANAPAGSTALVGAFQDVMNNMAQRLQTPQFAAPAQPQAPQLPAFLQGFANAGAPPAAQTPGGTTAPVTINIGGQGASVPLNQSTPVAGVTPPAAPAVQAAPNPIQGGYAPVSRQPGTYGQLSGAMPAYLQGMQPATPDFVHQLWSQELGAGAVNMPSAGA